MLLVAPTAWTKFRVASSTSVLIINGIHIRKYVLIHPAPATLAASSMSCPTWSNVPFMMFTPDVLPPMIITRSKAQIVPNMTERPGVVRNMTSNPNPDRIPGIAPEDQMIPSNIPRPRHVVRTMM